MKEITPTEGQLAQSTQGRDRGEYFVVCGVSGERVLLVNGVSRKRENPKSKNKKHVRLLPCTVQIKKDGAYNQNVALAIKEHKQQVKSED